MKRQFTQFARAYYAEACRPLPSGAYDELNVELGSDGYLTVEFHILDGKPAHRVAVWSDGAPILLVDPTLIRDLATARPTPESVKRILRDRGFEDVTPLHPALR